MTEMITNMRVIGKSSLLPFQKGIIQSNKALKGLYEDINLRYNCKFILTYHLNQDVLENFFGLIRSKGGLHDHPDQLEFRYRLRSYILGHNEGILSRSGNVEVDETPDIARSYKSLTGIIFSNVNPVVQDEEAVCQDLSDLKYDALEYLAGYICSRFKDDIPGIIEPRDLDNEPTTSTYSWVDHLSEGGLCKPTAAIMEDMEEVPASSNHHSTMEPETFENPSWNGEMAEQLGRLWTDEAFCDIILESDEKKIPAHRIILASVCPVFRAMLTGDMTESKNRNVTIDGVEGNALNELVRYCYTGRITITSEIVQSLLEGSDYLQLTWVRLECEKYFLKTIAADNVIQLHEYAERMNSTKLIDACESFLTDMFTEITMTEHFLSWSFDILIKLLRRGNLCVKDEQYVYEACIKWIRHDKENRGNHFEEIFESIRINDLPVDYVSTYIDDQEMVWKSKKCLKKLLDFKNFHLLPPSGRKLTPSRSYRQVIVVGKKRELVFPSFAVYDPLEEKWRDYDTKIQPFRFEPTTYKVASLGDKIFIASSGRENVIIYDFKEGRCVEMPYQYGSVDVYALCQVDNKMYFVYGNGNICYFCMQSETWSQEGLDMRFNNGKYGQAVHLNGFVYLIGGMTPSGDITNQLCRYDINFNCRTPLKAMQMQRCTHAACCLNGKIYVAGGLDSYGHVLKTVEVYDPETDEWQPVAQMNLERKFFELIAITGKIWAVGGYTESFMNTIEIYDPISDQWSFGPEITEPMDFYGCCVIDANRK